MNKLIGSVLALAMALAGCTGVEIRSPIVMKPSPQPAATAIPAQAVTPTPASAATPPASTSQPTKEPSTYASLQPFKKFQKGAGEGVAREYKKRNKA